MFCNKCGAQIEDNSAFCSECGVPVSQDDTAVVSQGFGSSLNSAPAMTEDDLEKTVAAPYIFGAQQAPVQQPVRPKGFQAPVRPQGYSQPPYGYPQQPKPQPQPPKKKKPVALIVISIILAVIILLGAGVFGLIALFTNAIRSVDKDIYYAQPEITKNFDYTYDEFEDALKNTYTYEEVATECVTEIATELVRNDEGDWVPVTEIVTEIVTENHKGLTTGDPAAIAEFYNNAVAATTVENANGEAYLVPKGKQTMALSKPISGDGVLGAILKVLQPAVDKALTNNCKDTDFIPGGKRGDLQVSDINKATAISKDGKTTLTIMLKDQVDGPNCDADTAGPVARGIGTLGSVDNVLEELGAEITEGRDTVRFTYRDAYIKCVVDEETGRIISGNWSYTVDIFIGNAKAKLGITANLKNFTAAVDYKVVI